MRKSREFGKEAEDVGHKKYARNFDKSFQTHFVKKLNFAA